MWTGYLVLLCLASVRCFVNLVHDQGLSGTAEMNLRPVRQEWGADKAVDGNTNQNYRHNSCAIGDISPNSVWWKVWLQKPFQIAYIEIYFRIDAFYRATGFSIYIFNDTNYQPPSNSGLVYHHEAEKGCIPENGTMNITLNKVIQGVAFFNTLDDRSIGNCIINNDSVVDIGLCEVRVMDCLDGYYKDNDRCKKCGNCKENSPCDKETGHCTECQPHWKPQICNECVAGFYGKNCSKQCGNCVHSFCNTENGICDEAGCTLNWEMPLCTDCVNGYYDGNCSTQCGNCEEGFCDKKNGSCLSGCKQNWQEPLCQECSDGMYGNRCSNRCGHCLEGFSDKTNGRCFSGCKLNWKEPLCQDCVDGFYGVDCRSQCEHCLGGACDKTNGTCITGCSKNWQEPLCQECVDGFYGESCNTQCRNCIQGLCYKRNGTCTNGCLQNWEGPMCQVLTTRESTTDDEEFSKTSLVVISVISTLLGVVLMGALIMIIYIKRKRCLPQNKRDHSNNDKMSHKDTEQKYDELKGAKEDHHYTTIDTANRESEYQEIHTYRNIEFNQVI